MASSSFSGQGMSTGRICLEEGVGGCTDNWLGWANLPRLTMNLGTDVMIEMGSSSLEVWVIVNCFLYSSAMS
jgi:hypothetical protein